MVKVLACITVAHADSKPKYVVVWSGAQEAEQAPSWISKGLTVALDARLEQGTPWLPARVELLPIAQMTLDTPSQVFDAHKTLGAPWIWSMGYDDKKKSVDLALWWVDRGTAQLVARTLISADRQTIVKEIGDSIIRIIGQAGFPVSFSQRTRLLQMETEDPYAFLIMGRGFAAAAAQDYENAAEQLERAVKIDPELVLARRGLGELMAKLGDYKAAHRHLGRVLDNWSSWSVRLQMAELSMALGLHGQAALHATEVLKIEPGNARATIVLGQTYAVSGNHKGAIEKFEEVIKKEPENWDALQQLRASLVEIGRLDRLIEVLQALRPRFPSDAQLLFDLGASLREVGRLEQASTLYRQMLGSDNDRWLVRYLLADVLALLEDETKTRELANDIQADRHLDARDCVLGGAALQLLGDGGAATIHLEQCQVYGEYRGQVRLSLGTDLLVKGNPTQALNLLSEAAVDRPNDPDVRLNLGIAYLRLGQFQSAIRQAVLVERFAPNLADGFHLHGSALLKQKRLLEAFRKLKVAAQKSPGSRAIKAELKEACAALRLRDAKRVDPIKVLLTERFTGRPSYLGGGQCPN